MRVLGLALLAPCVAGSNLRAQTTANPIRKVVNLLQKMQKQVSEEGDKEKDLYEKFMCYCKTGNSDLTASIGAAEQKLGELATDIEAAEAKHDKTKDELKEAKADRASGAAAMKEATALREKEAAVYAKFSADAATDIAAVSKAVTALEAGASAGFLQTKTARLLGKVVNADQSLDTDSRETLTAFLSNTNGYAPQSGQIIGILKEMHDEMSAGLADATKEEDSALAAYKELMESRLKEKAALTSAIEAKLTQVGDLAVSIAEMKNDGGDTADALSADKKFLAELGTSCKTKEADWQERSKTRSDELTAIADTIKILNDDDALELFKKTLPSPSISLLQTSTSEQARKSRALSAVKRARAAAPVSARARLDLIALALHGKKEGFSKVITMIDELVVALKNEQVDDDDKKAYCIQQLDQADDKKKGLERSISYLNTEMATAKESIATLAEEIAALTKGIAELDKSVAEATTNRQEEHEEFNGMIASNSAAKEILNLAKNRLQQFYNPKLAKTTEAPAPALFQLSAHRASPGPPPETYGAYQSSHQENGGVLALVGTLIADLDKQMTEGTAEEKDAQGDYTQLMADSRSKRSSDSKSLAQKQSAKADTQTALETMTEEKASAANELMATNQLIGGLHTECDWLAKYYSVRKQARAEEVDSLKNAKAVLSGADYSFLQRQ